MFTCERFSSVLIWSIIVLISRESAEYFDTWYIWKAGRGDSVRLLTSPGNRGRGKEEREGGGKDHIVWRGGNENERAWTRMTRSCPRSRNLCGKGTWPKIYHDTRQIECQKLPERQIFAMNSPYARKYSKSTQRISHSLQFEEMSFLLDDQRIELLLSCFSFEFSQSFRNKPKMTKEWRKNKNNEKVWVYEVLNLASS